MPPPPPPPPSRRWRSNRVRSLLGRLTGLRRSLLDFSGDDKKSIRNQVVAGLTLVVIVAAIGVLLTRLAGGDDADSTDPDPAAPGTTDGSDGSNDSEPSRGNPGTIVLDARLGDSARVDLMTSSDVALLRVPVRESSGWLLLDVLCDQPVMELSTPIVVEAVGDVETYWNPEPIDDCGNDVLFRDVSAGLYEFEIRLAAGVESGGFGLRAHVIRPPTIEQYLERRVLPQLPELLDVTIARTIEPRTVHAYPLPIDESTALAISPACPLEQALVIRIVDSTGEARFERRYDVDDCDVDQLTPVLGADDRHELHVLAGDPEAEVSYGLNTLADQ